MINKKYVSMGIYKRNKEFMINLKRYGVKFVFKKNNIRLGLGLACLVVAVIPNGLAFIAYPLGFFLLKINKVDIYNYKEKGLRKLKGWYYLK